MSSLASVGDSACDRLIQRPSSGLPYYFAFRNLERVEDQMLALSSLSAQSSGRANVLLIQELGFLAC